MKTREQIDSKYKWKLEDIYPTDQAWEQEYKTVEAEIPNLQALKSSIVSSSENLANGLKRIDNAAHKLERLFVYSHMRRDENNANPLYQGMFDRASSLSVKLSSALSYLNPLLLGMDENILLKFISECRKLDEYAFMIRDLIRSKKHVLSEKEEKLLSMSGDFAGGAKDIFTMLNNADLKFEPVKVKEEELPLSHGSYIVLMQNSDREVRKQTFENYYASFKGHINTISAAYATSVKKDVYFARARGYESALSKALFGDDVPVELYNNLIETVNQNLPVMHQYVNMRKKLLGVDELHMYDIYAPLVKDVDKKYPYEQSAQIVLQALSPLGEDYLQVLKSAFKTGWVDVYETQAKTSGAYSWGTYGVHPYVLLNHREDLDSVFTIAHEMGHAMHSYYSNKNQPYPLAGYTIFVAEVASTVNEILLTKYLLSTLKDDQLRRYVLNHYIDQFRTTVLRQTMFAEFEKISHEMCEQGKPLTAEELNNVYGALNAKYHGDGMAADDTIRYEWARIPHFYNAFYVYKYATGFSCAVQIANSIKEPGMLEKYIGFLSGGGSDYPLNLLKKAGIDLVSGGPVQKCMEEFKRALTEFEDGIS